MGYADINKRRQQAVNKKDSGMASLLKREDVRGGAKKALASFIVVAITMSLMYFACSGRSSFLSFIGVVVLPAFGFALVVFLYYVFELKKNPKNTAPAHASATDERDVLKEETLAWAEQVNTQGGLSTVHADISLRADEAVFYKSSAHLFEVRSVRVTNHAGGAMRLSRRVSLGGGQSVSESHEEWRPITRGDIYLTNKRIVFVGDKQFRMIDLKNVVSVKGGCDILEIVSETRSKSMRFSVRNWMIAKLILNRLMRSQGEPLASIVQTAESAMLDGGSIQADIEDPYKSGIDSTAVGLLSCLVNIVQRNEFIRRLDGVVSVPEVIRSLFEHSPLPTALCFAVVQDALKCHVKLGHAIDDLDCEDGFGLLSVIWLLTVPDGVGSLRILTSNHQVYEKMAATAKTLCSRIEESIDNGRDLIVVDLLRKAGDVSLLESYILALYDWANAIASVDGKITVLEQQWLAYIRSLAKH